MAELATAARWAGWSCIAVCRCQGAGGTRVAWVWGVGFSLGRRRAGCARLCQGGEGRVPEQRLHAWCAKLKGCHDEKRQEE